MFTLQEADYSFLFHQEASFPHSHFAMLADQHRLQACATALRKALQQAAARKQQGAVAAAAGQPSLEQHETACSHAAVAAVGGRGGGDDCSTLELSVVDVGCGSGVLSLLAAVVLSSQAASSTCDVEVPVSSCAATAPRCSPAPAQDAEAAAPRPSTAAATTLQTPEQKPRIGSIKGSVTGIELTAPLASVAQRAVAANGAAGVVSIVQADAASCRRAQQVPVGGADVIVLDVFDSGEFERVRRCK
jgi:hypothetical protein